MSQPLEVQAGELLHQRGLRLATAESCTGGLVGHFISNVPGSSDYFLGGVVSYANSAKQALLGVRAETLEAHGAVSQQTVLEMARGARHALGSELGLAISGIAGPGGGSPEKPVGLVWIGLSTPEGDQAWQYFFSGDRLEIKTQAAQAALRRLVEWLSGEGDDS